MKKILLFSLFINLFSLIHAETYSWENGGTILGSYGGSLVDVENVGPTDGINPFDGDYMLTVSESPIDGTPQAFIGWVTDISSGDDITACFYGYDITVGAAPSLRIWGSWSDNDDINAYAGSADGNEEYTDGSGWGEVCHTFSTSQENWDEGEALVIQARLYSSSSGPDPCVYFIDMLSVETNSATATIHFPGPVDDLTADAGSDQTVDAGSTVTLDGSGSVNPNGEIVAWQWEQTAGIAVILDDEEAMVTTFEAPAEGGDLSFDLTIFDSEGNESSDSVTITVQVEAGELTIAEIQGMSDSSPYLEQIVTTTGYVMGTAEYGFFIQDGQGAWNGIWVLDYGDATVDIGDEVQVTGIVEEYHNLTEINISDGGNYDILSYGNYLYFPTTIDMVEEAYESVLVTVSGVCESLPDDYGEWLLSDVWIDDLMYEFTPVLGQDYTITGCLNYSFGNYKVEPRDPSDVVEGSLSNTEPLDNFTILQTYPNPFNPEISIEFSTALGGNVEISIFNMLGQKLEILYNDITVPGVVNYINWDASQYGSGNYLIQVSLNQEVSSHIVTLIK